MQKERKAFYKPQVILRAVQEKIKKVRDAGERIDYLTFVPDGEPTLDINLEQEIDFLRALDIPVAVITNSSLIWQKGVRKALMKADWVSLKLDTAVENVWRRTDRPHRELNLNWILNGMMEFAGFFDGKLMTETMVLLNVNDRDKDLDPTADFLAGLNPAVAYVAIPTRPPAETWVESSDEKVLVRFYQVLSERIKKVEFLTGYEGDAFISTGNIETDLLAITAVHPMREDAIDSFLKKGGAKWEVVDRLLKNNKLIETVYQGEKFYVQRFRKIDYN